MRKIAILSVMFACLAIHAGAADIRHVACFTDREEYAQGDTVIIHVKNQSRYDVAVVDRDVIDGGFATIEIRREDDKWETLVSGQMSS